MNINTKATNVELTPAIHDYLKKKIAAFDKLINKNDESAALNVVLAKITRHHQKGDIFKAEMNLHISGKVLQASSEEQDIFAAIDLAKDEMMRELKSHKDKRIGILKRGGAKVKQIIKGIYKRD
ncbi:MAG: ribosome-associated translation inhibitor RaiA [Patescibacteria group bacterium]